MLDKTYRPSEVEAKHYALWESAGDFAAGQRPDAESYCIVIPPPNVTGSLHMGHALNNTLQDVLIRRERMRGRNTLWQPGMDHAGIATQMVVERQLEEEGTDRRQLGRERFVEKVWQWKEESGGTITRQLRRLGASCDWSRERFTMDDGLSRAVLKVFVALHKQGLIYKDKRLVNWDPKLQTAISDLEVQQLEEQGRLWHIKYPVEGEDGVFITVATTRPETMLGDTAVAVHPDDARYKRLVGKHAILPLVGRRLIIVADEHADPAQGSGAVKITPAHDFNDFEVGRRHGLEMINIFDAAANLNDNAPQAYRGLDRFKARARVVADLETQGLVAKVEDHPYVVPYGDRGGVPIEPWLTDQWYVDAAALAAPAIAAVEEGRTRFVPENWAKTYFDWMRNIQPWCVSRQLWWGHRIPAWYGPDGEVFVEETEAEALAAAQAHYGKATQVRGQDEVIDAFGEVAQETGEGILLSRDEDVLDTWFSSALWPFSTLGWPDETPALARFYPTDVLVTGFDIIFFWVARMMMMGRHFMGAEPFHTVYIHALVRDAQGQKMSKSKGNIIDPLELIDKFGADALRFTLCALAVPGRDIKLSESRVEGYRNFATKLWNAARYCLMNGARIDPAFELTNCKLAVNRWIVSRVAQTGREIDAAIAVYRFNDAAEVLYHFTWGTFCDWYLEFTKPILAGEDAAAAAETRAVMGWTLGQLLHLLHPFTPFITEELWEHLGGTERGRLITAAWPEYGDDLIDPRAAREMEWVIQLISEVRAVRAEMKLPAAAKFPVYVKDAGQTTLERLDRHTPAIIRLAHLSDLYLTEYDSPEALQSVLEGSVPIFVDGETYLLQLAGIIDIEKERARLLREVEKIQAEIVKFDKKLANEQFLAKAPREVVEAQRERRDETARERDKWAAALARLEG